MEEKKRPIAVIGAMGVEVEYFLQIMDTAVGRHMGMYRFYEGQIDGYPVVVVWSLMGHVNAAAATALLIEEYDPKYIIIQGTAGGHSPDVHRGDIVIGEKVVELGMYFSPHKNEEEDPDLFDRNFPGAEFLDGEEQVMKTMLESDQQLVKLAETVPYNKGKVKKGIIASADAWNRELPYIAHLRKRFGTECEEMEGFAVLQTAWGWGIPAIDIRIISNNELYREETYQRELGAECQRFVLEFIRRIIARMA